MFLFQEKTKLADYISQEKHIPLNRGFTQSFSKARWHVIQCGSLDSSVLQYNSNSENAQAIHMMELQSRMIFLSLWVHLKTGHCAQPQRTDSPVEEGVNKVAGKQEQYTQK
jgi:hypothetical protein